MNLRDEALRLRARYDEEPAHSDHVTALTLALFDGWAAWHGLAPRDRDLLEAAALLHDIGWSQVVDGAGHHKWSARLIRQQNWTTLDAEETAVVAQVARYHRKALPSPDHAEFQALPPEARRKVEVLAGLLRVGDALDRTHTARVAGVTASVTDAALDLRVRVPGGEWTEERVMVEAKKDLLERVSARLVRCRD